MCEGCMEIKPELKKVAKKMNWKYKEINVENCRTKFCDTIEVVPIIVVDGKNLNEEEMYEFVEKIL